MNSVAQELQHALEELSRITAENRTLILEESILPTLTAVEKAILRHPDKALLHNLCARMQLLVSEARSNSSHWPSYVQRLKTNLTSLRILTDVYSMGHHQLH